jgi:hypothetical protein
MKQLLERQGVVVPYGTQHRFAVSHCGFGAAGRVTVRMADVLPGELAEIDFGRLGLVYDPETQRLWRAPWPGVPGAVWNAQEGCLL